MKGIEELKKEIRFITINYEKHSKWITEFYSMFYRHYQLAQRTANADIIRHPDREDENTKQKYMETVDELADEWNKAQGVARILLPSNLLELHEEAVDKFNEFKNAVKKFDNSDETTRKNVMDRFKELHELKEKMEIGVRKYLRSDNLK